MYEQLRAKATAGGDVSHFVRWGMILVAPRDRRRAGGISEVRRRRASVRAGDFSLKELLIEMRMNRVVSPGSSNEACMEEVS